MAAATDTETVFDDGKVEPLSSTGSTPVLSETTVVVGNDGTPRRVTVSIDKTAAEELRTTGDFILAKANAATNAEKTPKRVEKANSALFPEKTLVGYTNDKPTPLTAVTINGFDMEKITGYDWFYMRAAAARDGVHLRVNSAFRDPEQQRRLIAERMNPDGTLTEAGKRLGRAGPISGNKAGGHLMGQAIDIGTGMTVADMRAALIRGTPEEVAIRESHVSGSKKPATPYTPARLEEKVVADLLVLAMKDYTRLNAAQLSATFTWLVQNAANFGFFRTAPTEPWHWSHTSRTIVTKNVDIGEVDTLLVAATSSASTATALRTDKPEASLAMDRAVHDISQSMKRSAQMSRTTRATLFAQQARHAVLLGAEVNRVASRYEAQLGLAALPAPTYKPGVLTAASFDYATGTWKGSNV